MYSEKQMIVFRIEYRHEKGWGAVSNFLTKYAENVPMDSADVEDVSSFVLADGICGEHLELIKAVERNRYRFRKINRPENIYVSKEQYDYLIFVNIHDMELSDVVELQNLFLIWDACKNTSIMALITGEDSSFYRISHYFEFLTEDMGEFYESVFFCSQKDHRIKHLQIKNIGVLEKFLPLLLIDRSSEQQLRQPMSHSIKAKVLEEILNGSEVPAAPRMIAGALRGIGRNKRLFVNCDAVDCACMLAGLNVLTFLLFSFSVRNRKQAYKDMGEMAETLQYISLWANGCQQLIENIIFHSKNRRGAFSFRILEKDAVYLKEKYGETRGEGQCIELMISDYPGCYQERNMAQTFRHNLKDPKQQEEFCNLQPVDFFVNRKDERLCAAWEKYYADYKNLINHYGLKIFRNVVEKNGGCFMMQSFGSHVPQKGEYYCPKHQWDDMGTCCLPGTSYSVVYVAEKSESSERHEDFGIEETNRRPKDKDELFLYDVSYPCLDMGVPPTTAEDKACLIKRIADQLLGSNDGGSNQIWAVKTNQLQSSDAEIIYKAVILAVLECQKNIHVVLYDCSHEFVRMFLDIAYHMWNNLRDKRVFSNKETQIALYTEQLYEEILIFPGDWYSTLDVNIRSNFSRETRWKEYFEKWRYPAGNVRTEARIAYIPFDVLVKADEDCTIFEQYVRTVVQRNIQGKELGCKLENTHMRLGSTIHVNHFYEAEVLFGNALFVERFAFLLVQSLLKESGEGRRPLKADSHVTLYGYTNYSEQVIFRTMQLLKERIDGIDVDYAILERETENRGFTHIDQIRYSRHFLSRTERRSHFECRSIICIIPIASTLKTNEKLINLFCEENGKHCQDHFIHNYELILVGSEQENDYWEKSGRRIVGKKGLEISPEPEFFVEVKLNYLDPLKCNLCFPQKLVDEIPLVEVNAASTIPNQAFGIMEERERYVLRPEKIEEEEAAIRILKDSMMYRHLMRGENHFLFYCQTNLLFLQCHQEIGEWLSGIRENLHLTGEDFVVLFCPSHFSNAGFIEYVNSIVFQGAAVVLRDDVDKEYRCNFCTKYSNLHSFTKKLASCNQQAGEPKRRMRFFFVDDAIISGRTFQRSKSLVQSLIGDASYSERQRYGVFDGVFVLLDRNSRASRWQYVGVNEDREHFFAFCTLHISSIRNHGDACILCNLENESGILKESAVTREMSDYWKKEEEKFSPKLVGSYLQEEQKAYDKESDEAHHQRMMKKERAFRRLICTNNANIFLNDKYHGNNKKETLILMMTLVLEGCGIQKPEDRAEYFLSYCKVLSRPFRVFDKAVKEAVFDFLLVLGEGVISCKPYDKIINGSEEKMYLQSGEIRELFRRTEQFVSEYFNEKKAKQDLILVLLKQLTELKSNFIIRVEMMNHLAEYAKTLKEEEQAQFYENYQRLVKKLLGISSDTSKSVWFDRVLFHRWEESGAFLLDMPEAVIERIYLENVRVYQDAYKKINDRLKDEEIRWAEYFCHDANQITENELSGFGTCIEPYIKGYQFKDFIWIMEQYGYYSNMVPTDQGRILTAANVLLYRYINSEFEGELSYHQEHEEDRLLDKCNYISTYMNYILDAQKTMIVMELEAEYDIWEDILIERYNNLAKNNCEEIALKAGKEYIVLGSSECNKASDEVREGAIISRMQRFCEEGKWKKQGYVYDNEQHIFLWELGQDVAHPVYVYSEWKNPKNGIERLNRIRNVMQYYWKLNERVFNRSNNGFFHELVANGKKLLIHSRYKAHSHTKSDIRLKQFEHVNFEDRYKSYYQSDLLMLLADLNVSEHYRNSLTKEYYIRRIPTTAARWNSEISFYREENDFYVINSDGVAPVGVRFCYDPLFEGDTRLRKDEPFLCFDYTNAEQEPLLLLYSLVANAATDNRGLAENEKVTVWFSKTKQKQLRIANIIGENTEGSVPEIINEKLKMPPLDEKDGISLWSMSRYVKQVIASIIESQIKRVERLSETEKQERLPKLREMICRLLSDEFEIRVERGLVGGKEYFSVLVPILWEKYIDFLEDRRI